MPAFWMFRLKMWWDTLAFPMGAGPFLPRNRVRSFTILLAVAIMTASGFVARAFWPQQAAPTTAKARKLAEKGNYDDALRIIETNLQKNPNSKPWADMKDSLLKEMKVDLRLLYYRQNKSPRRKAKEGKLDLSPSDSYYFVVDPSESCYLYLIQVNGIGDLKVVYPETVADRGTRQVAPGARQIPSGPQKLHLDNVKGMEKVLMVAARWQIPELLELARQAEAETDAARRKTAHERLLARVDIERRYAGRLGGLVFGEGSFLNTGLPAAN